MSKEIIERLVFKTFVLLMTFDLFTNSILRPTSHLDPQVKEIPPMQDPEGSIPYESSHKPTESDTTSNIHKNEYKQDFSNLIEILYCSS